MPRDIVNPAVDEDGRESHPAWAMIGASRVSSGPPGATLFDSDIRHAHTVMVRISTASRKRDLHRDWLYGERQFVEVEMSEAQWASFVSSMNVGSGVPCTVRFRADADPPIVPGMPFDSRLQASMDEVRTAADDAAAAVAEAFATYAAHKTAANLRSLEWTIKNMPANLEFAASSLTRHTEDVVQKARADIEAFVVAKAGQLGIEPGELGVAGLLTAPEGGE
jgi:hypothetical protein